MKLFDRLALVGSAGVATLALMWMVYHPWIVAATEVVIAAGLLLRRVRSAAVVPVHQRCTCDDPLHRIHAVGACRRQADRDGLCDVCEAFLQANAARLVEVLRRESEQELTNDVTDRGDWLASGTFGRR